MPHHLILAFYDEYNKYKSIYKLQIVVDIFLKTMFTIIAILFHFEGNGGQKKNVIYINELFSCAPQTERLTNPMTIY